jgi:hypothetical protein
MLVTDYEKSATEFLAERVLYLQKQLDESVVNETALIGTLKELVPGFAPRFDQLRNGAKRMIDQRDREEIERFLSELKRQRQKPQN